LHEFKGEAKKTAKPWILEAKAIKFGLGDYITACRLVCVFEEVHLAVSSFLITILKQLKVTSERPLRRCAWRKKAPMHNN